ncbi:MAG: radical SAM family heme chaperone HemW [Candidatus Obscuribacterales bacterium]|nr:radical SAM family heme chaperone HemW [Candidatus Obscuribacterales bacterium]
MPKSAYIHIPFCAHKCDFCDFAVVTNLESRIPEYCQTVSKEIRQRLANKETSLLDTVFYGGGTPGYIDPKELALIHQTLVESVGINEDAEVTLETTPNVVTVEKAQAWLDLGINRLSIGIESVNDHELTAMGRDHTRAQALLGVKAAQEAGFENIAIDLMYGLPEQTLDSWHTCLEQSLLLGLPHLSSYALTLATNSPLLRRYPLGSPQMPDDDLSASMYEMLVDMAQKAGLEQYEVSNFARPGFASRHNLTYWQNDEYYGFGLSAHRYVDGIRSHNWRSFNRYLDDYLGHENFEIIDSEMRVKEAIILGLRTTAGINLQEFEKRYGVNLLSKFGEKIAEFTDQQLFFSSDSALRLTAKGMLLSNLVLAEFI